jgi:DNA polymerase-3 subunit beta
MKLTISKETLLDSINWINRVLPARPVLPILSNILIEAKDTNIILSASNLETSSRSEKLATIKEEGQAIVQGRLFSEIIKSLPNQDVLIEKKNNKLNIKCGKAQFVLPTVPENNYPEIQQIPEKTGEIDTKEFLDAILQVGVAAAKEDSTPVLTTIKFDIDNEFISLSAIDRYRIAKKKISWKPKEKIKENSSILIKGKNITEIIKGLEGNTNTNIHFEKKEDNKIGFSSEDKTSVLQLLSGDFPQTDQLFKDEYDKEIVVEKSIILESINRVGIISDPNVGITFNINKNKITLSTGEKEETNAEDEIPCLYEQDEISVKFNSTYIKEGISQIDEKYLVIKIDESTKPVEIIGIDKPGGTKSDNYRYVIVPIRVT